jgi:hypothetical protein
LENGAVFCSRLFKWLWTFFFTTPNSPNSDILNDAGSN